jgi:ABC-type transporter Mla subunit MlaD
MLVVFGVAASVALVVFLSGSRISDGLRFETYLQESVQGLQEGAPVKYRGVTVGTVTDIALVTAVYDLGQSNLSRPDFRLVVVRFVVDPKKLGHVPEVDESIRIGLRIRLASQGLTGLSYLELDFVDPKKFAGVPDLATLPWHPEYPVIPSIPSTIAQVQDAAQDLLAKLNAIDLDKLAATTQAILDDVHQSLSSGDTHVLLAQATQLLKTLQGTVEAADLPDLSADLKATSTGVRTLVQGHETKQLLASVTRTADRLSESANRLPQLIASLQALVQRANNGAADVQADLVPVLRDARAAASNLRETTETLRRYPSSVLLGEPPPRTSTP